jgi:mannitol/fructose-specific phosphotransferase system IIA component (Ntr-type)
MKSLLDALQEGRLVELPTNDKNKVLEVLALLLEAVPGIQTNVDVVQEIKDREAEGNTGLGKGIACPHIRIKHEGDLLCAVGWSPAGIDYGSADGKKVHIVIMYYIPDTQRVAYLKELSSLAKAVVKASSAVLFESIADIHTVRSQLLDWVEMSVNDAQPDATARMIRLEQKQRTTETVSPAAGAERKSPIIIPFTFIGLESGDYKILAQDKDFVDHFETGKGLSKLLTAPEELEAEGFYLAVISSVYYASNRVVRECVAVKK